MTRYIILLGEDRFFATTNPIQAMAERAIAMKRFSRIYHIRLAIEED